VLIQSSLEVSKGNLKTHFGKYILLCHVTVSALAIHYKLTIVMTLHQLRSLTDILNFLMASHIMSVRISLGLDMPISEHRTQGILCLTWCGNVN